MPIPEPDLDELYREIILDHYRNPRGRGHVEDPQVRNEGFNPVCGDEVSIALRLAGDRIEEIEVQGRGCSISVASGSILAAQSKGKTLKEVGRVLGVFEAMMRGEPVDGEIDVGDLEAFKGVRKFPVRIKCALLPWVTLRDAVRTLGEGGPDPGKVSTTESKGDAIHAAAPAREGNRPAIPCETSDRSDREDPPGGQ
jgi:nitrogen fixation NifU-like protein